MNGATPLLHPSASITPTEINSALRGFCSSVVSLFFWVMAPRQCLIGHRRFDRMWFPQLFNLWRQDHHGVWKLHAPVFRWRGSLPSRMEIWTSASILPPLYSIQNIAHIDWYEYELVSETGILVGIYCSNLYSGITGEVEAIITMCFEGRCHC